MINALDLSGDESELGKAISGLARVAKASKPRKVESEFNALFVGLGRGELLPYASYYLTGFLNEKPLATLRSDMAVRTMTVRPNVYEPEDNIASLMEMMAGMIVVALARLRLWTIKRRSLTSTSRPGPDISYSDLEAAKNSILYASVGNVGREFMEIEREAFRMTAK